MNGSLVQAFFFGGGGSKLILFFMNMYKLTRWRAATEVKCCKYFLFGLVAVTVFEGANGEALPEDFFFLSANSLKDIDGSQ